MGGEMRPCRGARPGWHDQSGVFASRTLTPDGGDRPIPSRLPLPQTGEHKIGDVGSNTDADRFIAGLGKETRKLAQLAHNVMIELGCSSYVKTIYIGYEIDGEMVSALYGSSDHVEIALALPEDAAGEILVDASHLTWRTLPVAAILRSREDALAFRHLAAEAADRVRRNEHDVLRENDHFIRSRRERKAVQ